MRLRLRRTRDERPPATDPDAGYTMLEVVIAMAVFTLLAGSALTVLTGTLRLTGSNAHRATAAGLASSQLEQVRATRALDIPDGLVTRTVTVGGTAYTVAQTSDYVPNGGTGSVCAAASGDQLAYKLISVQVTWPAMGSVQPVRADTLRALGVGTDGLDSSTGVLAVDVTGAHGDATSGVLVTLSPSGATRTTGSDGCAVFTGLAPGSYAASAGQVGDVSAAGTRATSTGSQTVTAAAVQRAQLHVDASASRTTLLAPPAGYTAATGLALVLHGAAFTDAPLPDCAATTAARTCTSGVPGQVLELYPDTYQMWAGGCSDSGASPASFDAGAGGAAAVSVPLAGVLVTATAADGTPAAGTAVYAVHAPDSTTAVGSTCPGGQTVALGTTGATGALAAGLPFGSWTITTSPSGTGPSVQLTASAPTATAAVTR